MKKILALLGVVLLTACASLTPVKSVTPTPSVHVPSRCEKIIVEAYISQLPVVGAYKCLSPTLQAAASNIGVVDDATFASYALQPPVFTSVRYCNQMTSGIDAMRLQVDSSGLVSLIQWKPFGNGCT
jgi:hypothetical protein